jgi:hypothetical protein
MQLCVDLGSGSSGIRAILGNSMRNQKMKLARHLILTASISMFFAGSAWAAVVPITVELTSVTAVDAAVDLIQAYTPPLPITGGYGNLDVAGGSGWLRMPDYDFTIDALADATIDSEVNVSGWLQIITGIDGGNNVTTTGIGLVTCVDAGGGFGTLVCDNIPTDVMGWPPPDGEILLSSAIIDTGAQTFTVIDNSNALAGTVTSIYTYGLAVPEPSTALLLGAGLIGFAALRRQRLA